ncbi:MAG: hypothetical protein ACXWTX_06640, partial [Gallionella sp.]
WGIYQAIVNSGCIAAPPAFTLPLTVPTTPLSTVNYTVTVTCALTPAAEGSIANNVNVYQITATAINASVGRFYVERRLTATVTQ